MRRTTWLLLSGVVLLLTLPLAFVALSEQASRESQSNHAQCPTGPLVIDVTQKVVNSADAGVTGKAWALDDFVRQIQVVQAGPSQFCATVYYRGNFTTFAGPSPQTTGTVDAGVVGTFEGGFFSTIFTATLKSSPSARTTGSIGTFDHQCNASFDCPGFVSWPGLYFDNISGFGLAWWSWVYQAGNNGTWVNSIEGNSGDITGN